MANALKMIFVMGTLLLLAHVQPASAQLNEGFGQIRDIAQQSGLSVREPEEFIKLAINTLLSFVGLVALAVVIWGGVLYITSAGDEDRAAKGKRLVLYAIVGLLLIGASAIIVNLAISLFTGNAS